MDRKWGALGCAMLGFAGAVEAKEASLPQWLSGCWIENANDRRVEEVWLPPAGDAMVGVGRTVRGDVVRNIEYMRIDIVAGVATFTAIPSDQPQASFPAIRQTANEIVFENLAHDFPQKIVYRSLAPDRLQALIEGPLNGTIKTIAFDYRRCEE